MYTIRPFHPTTTEYEAIVAVHDAAWPDERRHPVATWRENDEEWPAGFLNHRLVAEADGAIVAVAACSEKYWQHRPGTVHLRFDAHPDHDGPDMDALLYQALLSFLHKRNAPLEILATETREDRPGRIHFLEARGFAPVQRTPRSTLSVTAFAAIPFLPVEKRIAEEGIRIVPLTDLIAVDPAWKDKLYELRWALVRDVPSVEPPARPTMAEFEQMVLDDPAFAPEAWFIAVVEEDRYVGLSNLWLNDETGRRLDAGLTGVRRSFRRRGIATALKLHTIRYAQQRGAGTIATSNEENNPMYALNRLLGFRPLPAWLEYRKEGVG